MVVSVGERTGVVAWSPNDTQLIEPLKGEQ